MTEMNKNNVEALENEKFSFMVVVKENEMGVMLPDKEGTYRLFRLSWSERTDHGWNRLEVTDPDGVKHDSWSEDHEEYKGWVTVLYKEMKYDFEVTPLWDDPEDQTYTDEYEVLIRVYEMEERDSSEDTVEVSENASHNRWVYEYINGKTGDAPHYVLDDEDANGDQFLHFKSVKAWNWREKKYSPTTAVWCGKASGWHDATHYNINIYRLQDYLDNPVDESLRKEIPVMRQRPEELVYEFYNPSEEGGYSFVFWNGYILSRNQGNGTSMAACMMAAKRIRLLQGEEGDPADEQAAFDDYKACD